MQEQVCKSGVRQGWVDTGELGVKGLSAQCAAAQVAKSAGA